MLTATSIDLKFKFEERDDAAAVWFAALQGTPPQWNGLLRQDIKVEPLSGGVWKITVSYGTTGVGGGNYPLG